MFRERCEVTGNRKVAPGHYVLELRSSRIARSSKPGQFVQVLCSDSDEPLLPRPFSFLTADRSGISLLYQVVGRGTRLLAQLQKGDTLRVLGPLGKGFSAKKAGTAILVGGGVGIPPLYHLAQTMIASRSRRPKDIHVFLGARHRSLLLCETPFVKLGVDLHVATDDGSKGKKGLVTGIFEDFLKTLDPKKTVVYTCGPTPMLKAVSAISEKYGTPCEVSVEVPMAGGFGACLGCAIRVKADGGHRFAVACTEGPVFCGSEVLWD